MDNQTPSSSGPPATPESLTSGPAPISSPSPAASSGPPGFTTQPVTTAPLPGMPSGSLFPKSSPLGGGSGGSPIMFALIAILGLGALVFGVMAVTSYNKATVATRTLNAQVAAAVAKAKDAQQKDDADANTKANESPFRSYVAPTEDGSFEIKFPKDWSSYVDQEQFSTQVKLVINPDFVRRTNGNDELVATRVELIERTRDSFLQAFASNVKSGKLKQVDTTVSGQRAYDITGEFPDKKSSRIVVVPVRDKVIVFTNENSKYAAEFNEILAQAKINP